MKKLVFFVFIFFILFLSIPHQGVSQQTNSEADYQVIPDEAIRLRILANSDRDEDQQIKRLVRDEVNESITKWVKDIADINEARKVIQEQLPEIKRIVANTLKRENEDRDFQVEYGTNVSFPTKLYGSYLYPAGEYEAVLITLGEGKGANWWCVLFPPLCFLDFSNGTSVASAADKDMEMEDVDKEQKADEVEVKFFLFEWIDSVIDFLF
ncbi:stage II sporulation protein R [Virgibacillus ndiopensis]|uniref:stage II sporulation protein R n=1 Tax=Virgibacillus ndiopensis TaxID=2004408 RepID=UPI000C07EF2F|nr:stage II sporulation protein R [Virgibacillus ndiopensis]